MKKVLKLCRQSLAAVACAALIICFGCNNSSESSKQEKNIGIQLYSVMDAVNKNPQASIERLAKMGYKTFELVQWGGNPKVFGLSAEEFKTLCDNNGTSIVSTHSGIQEDPAKEEEIMNSWRQLFEIQKACGGKYFG